MRAIAVQVDPSPPEAAAATPGALPHTLVELELPAPSYGPADLLVQVEAVAVNPIDTKVRASLSPGSAPRVLGWDFAGQVVAVGAAVTGFKPGDRVVGAGDSMAQGCQADLVRIEACLAAHAPAGLSAAAAAALPLTTITAWEALFEQLAIDPAGSHRGQPLLIIGAGGGVGSMAVQLARWAGLQVVATASTPDSRAWVEELGAHLVLDHREPLRPQLEAMGLNGVDWILNCHDTDRYWVQAADLLRPFGALAALVSCRGPLDLNLFKAKSLRFCWEFMFSRPQFHTADRGRHGEILSRLRHLVEAGTVRSTLRHTLGPISAARMEDAHQQLLTGHTTGKIALEGWP